MSVHPGPSAAWEVCRQAWAHGQLPVPGSRGSPPVHGQDAFPHLPGDDRPHWQTQVQTQARRESRRAGLQPHTDQRTVSETGGQHQGRQHHSGLPDGEETGMFQMKYMASKEALVVNYKTTSSKFQELKSYSSLVWKDLKSTIKPHSGMIFCTVFRSKLE